VRTLTIVTAFLGLLSPGTSNAESAAGSLKSFGLIGMWSEDCTKDAAQQSGTWIAYTQSSSGPPTTMTIMRTPTGIVSIRETEIQSASRIAEDKITYRFIVTKQKLIVPNMPETDQTPNKLEWETVIQKFGSSEFKFLDSRSTDGNVVNIEAGEYVLPSRSGGTTRQPTPLFQKCLN